jgi:arylsulfatase A-like enzyme
MVEDFPLFTETLKDKGLNTGAVAGSVILEAEYGLSVGFNFYDDKFKKYTTPNSNKKLLYRKTADQVVDSALEWLGGQDTSQPVFLFLHFYDAHTDYDLAPDKYLKMFKTDKGLRKILKSRNQKWRHQKRINQYDGCLRFIDDSLARFFEYLRKAEIYDNALIIITSDHGEGLGEHNWYAHGLYVYEEQMHIPLVIRFPGGTHAEETFGAMVNLLDLAPTILDFLDAPALPDARGKSLLGIISGENESIREYEIFERRWFPGENFMNKKNWAPGEKFGVRGDRWKYIWASDEPDEFFDLENDPHELNNTSSDNAEITGRMKEELEKYWDLVKKGPIAPQGLKKEERQKLKALGYLR